MRLSDMDCEIDGQTGVLLRCGMFGYWLTRCVGMKVLGNLTGAF